MATQYFDVDDVRVWRAVRIEDVNRFIHMARAAYKEQKALGCVEGMEWQEKSGKGLVVKLESLLAKFKADFGVGYRLKNSAI